MKPSLEVSNNRTDLIVFRPNGDDHSYSPLDEVNAECATYALAADAGAAV